MISYLIDWILFVALVFTSFRVTAMYRELVRLRVYQGEFTAIIGQTNAAFDSFMSATHEFSATGTNLVENLSHKIDEARATLAELDRCVAGAPGDRGKFNKCLDGATGAGGPC